MSFLFHHQTSASRSSSSTRLRRSSIDHGQLKATRAAVASLINDISASGIPVNEAGIMASLTQAEEATSVRSPPATMMYHSPSLSHMRHSISDTLHRIRRASHKRGSQDSTYSTDDAASGTHRSAASSPSRDSSATRDRIPSLPTSHLASYSMVAAPATPPASSPMDELDDFFPPPMPPHRTERPKLIRSTASAPTIPSHHLPHLPTLRKSRHTKVPHVAQAEEEVDSPSAHHHPLSGEPKVGLFATDFDVKGGDNHTPESSRGTSVSSATNTLSSKIDLLSLEGEHQELSDEVSNKQNQTRRATHHGLSTLFWHSSHHRTHQSREDHHPPVLSISTSVPSSSTSCRFEDSFPPDGQIRKLSPNLQKWQEELTHSLPPPPPPRSTIPSSSSMHVSRPRMPMHKSESVLQTRISTLQHSSSLSPSPSRSSPLSSCSILTSSEEAGGAGGAGGSPVGTRFKPLVPSDFSIPVRPPSTSPTTTSPTSSRSRRPRTSDGVEGGQRHQQVALFRPDFTTTAEAHGSLAHPRPCAHVRKLEDEHHLGLGIRKAGPSRPPGVRRAKSSSSAGLLRDGKASENTVLEEADDPSRYLDDMLAL